MMCGEPIPDDGPRMHPRRRATDPRGGVVGWLAPGQPDRAIVPWWQDPGMWAAAAWAVAVLVFNTTASGDLGQVTGTLVACPLLAAGMVQRVWRVVAAGAIAVAMLFVSAAVNGPDFDFAQQVRVGGIVVATMAGVGVALVRLVQRQQLVTIGEIARVAQDTILQPIPSRVRGLEIETRYVSAREDASVGGDGYELADTRFGPRLLVADVRGKGLGATRTMAMVLGAFREWAHEEERLDRLLVRLHDSVSRQLDEGDFVTALVAELGPHRLRFASAGHPPPFRGRGALVEWLECRPSPPLGLLDIESEGGDGSDGTDGTNRQVRVESLRQLPGDVLAFVTDGLLEPHERGGELLPWQTLVRPMSDSVHGRDGLTSTADSMVGVAQDWTRDGMIDDAALVLCRVLPASEHERS